jgi:hypothetical protein
MPFQHKHRLPGIRIHTITVRHQLRRLRPFPGSSKLPILDIPPDDLHRRTTHGGNEPFGHQITWYFTENTALRVDRLRVDRIAWISP